MVHQKTLKLTAFLVASTLSSMSYGAGFAIIEQSVTGLGRAFAGQAAVAEDASTIFFNPAGLTQLEEIEIDQGLHIIAPRSKFDDDGSAVPNYGGLGGYSGQALTGGDGSNAGSVALVPNFYIAIPLSETLVAGLGVNAPFGLVTEWASGWEGKTVATYSDMRTFCVNPVVSIQVHPRLSLAVGLTISIPILK